MPQSITSLRRTLRQRRNNITPQDKARFDYSINQTFIQSGAFLRSSSIASYLANDGEPSVDFIIKSCTSIRRPHYLPVLNKRRLKFSPYSWGDKLKNNVFNIPEPDTTQSFSARFLTTILMPLVGFNQQGHRLGMGGGYYDRTLGFMLNLNCKNKPLLIGIAYSSQMHQEITHQPWDIPLDAVITEHGLITFSTKAKQLLRAL